MKHNTEIKITPNEYMELKAGGSITRTILTQFQQNERRDIVAPNGEIVVIEFIELFKSIAKFRHAKVVY